MQRYKKNDSIITQQGLSIILGRSIILETEVKEKKKWLAVSVHKHVLDVTQEAKIRRAEEYGAKKKTT